MLTPYSRLVDCLKQSIGCWSTETSFSRAVAKKKRRHLSDLRPSEWTDPLWKPWGWHSAASLGEKKKNILKVQPIILSKEQNSWSTKIFFFSGTWLVVMCFTQYPFLYCPNIKQISFYIPLYGCWFIVSCHWLSMIWLCNSQWFHRKGRGQFYLLEQEGAEQSLSHYIVYVGRGWGLEKEKMHFSTVGENNL